MVVFDQCNSYLENGGENAIVQPWVWIAWLFVGPTIGSIAFQWYIFIAVRLGSFLLVF